MWLKIQSLMKSKNILILGIVMSLFPIGMIFFIVREFEKLDQLYRHSIYIQSKLDDIDEGIKDWSIIAITNNDMNDNSMLMAKLTSVNQDIFVLTDFLNHRDQELKEIKELERLWAQLRMSGVSHITDKMKKIDLLINEIDHNEEIMAQQKQAEISKLTTLAKEVSAISILIGLCLTLLSVYLSQKNLDFEKKINEDLKKSELKALESSKMKANFLAIVSHEIRTPLNGIIGLSDVLRKMNLKNEEFNYVQLIHNSGQTLLKIINDILDYSKIESGKLDLEENNFSLREVVDQVVSTLNAKAKEKSIHLDFYIDEECPQVLCGDASRISQILFNLVGNSIKFTSKGSVIVNIRRELLTDQHKARITFSVSDTGCGMTIEQQNKLFQPFTQLQKVGTSGEAGTGLGLSISRQILLAMKSDIFVDSKVNFGTQFYFTLDFSKFSQEKIISSQVQFGPIRKHQKPDEIKKIFENDEVPTILVVEDNPTNQVTIQIMLEKLGAKVILASNGSESLSFVKQTKIDLIFMDCQMPIMDGFEATCLLRNERIHIPIIAMTANVAIEDQRACFDAGMNFFMSKPLSLDIISQELTRILKPQPNYICTETLNDLEHAIGVQGKSKVIKAFLSGKDELKKILTEFIQSPDLDKIKQTAHRYKSSSEVVGGKGLGYLFKRLEKTNSVSLALTITEKILEVLPEIDDQLKKHI